MIYGNLKKDIEELTNKPCVFNIGQLEEPQLHSSLTKDTLLLSLPTINFVETQNHILIKDLQLTLTLVSLTLQSCFDLSTEVYNALFNKELPTYNSVLHIMSQEPGINDTVHSIIYTLVISRIELKRPDHVDYVRKNLRARIKTN